MNEFKSYTPGEPGSDPNLIAESVQPKAPCKLDVKAAINLRIHENSPVAESVEKLARESPDETVRREFLVSMIAPSFNTPQDVHELARLLGMMDLIGPDDPLVSQFTDWGDEAMHDERRLRVLEIAGSKLSEDTLWRMARPQKNITQRGDYAMDNQPQL